MTDGCPPSKRGGRFRLSSRNPTLPKYAVDNLPERAAPAKQAAITTPETIYSKGWCSNGGATYVVIEIIPLRVSIMA
jgi:hypothetical protein